MNDPERVSATYRDLSQRAGVAVGSVKAGLDWLQRRGFLRIFGQGRGASRTLVKRRELLERWTEAYGERLRPKLQIGRYRVQGDGMAQITQMDSFHAGQASWGGEMAVSLLLGEQHYQPGTRTL